MKTFFLGIFISTLSIILAFSQNPSALPEKDDDPILSRLDSFLIYYNHPNTASSPYDTILNNVGKYRSEEIPSVTPAVIQQRLDEIPSAIPLDYNIYVQRFIDVYTKDRREQVSRMLGLKQVYFPIFEEALDREGLPMEFKYLPIVESALNPFARSRVGATGLWQFMYQTGREYGLKVNSFVDERRDPYKSTQAAVEYLKRAHNEFGDWMLALASYNCGIGNVRKAIYRSGGKRNFWEIRAYLPRETRGYVPAFIAAMYTFKHAGDHNIYPVYTDFNYLQDTLQLRKVDITLPEIAKMTGSNLDELRNLNPHLKLDKVPYTSQAFILRVPQKVSEYFAANELAIREKYGVKRKPGIPTYAKGSSSGSTSGSYDRYARPPGTVVVYYTVRSGDVVGTIAEKYSVSARNIAYWNNLRRYRIKPGQKLLIYAKKSVADRNAKRKTNNSSTSVALGPQQGTYHRVKQGDTLWGLAQQFTNGDLNKILALNKHLSARSKLSIGEKVRVR